MPIWQLCANLLIPNCLRSNLSYSPLAALELYVNNTKPQIIVTNPLYLYDIRRIHNMNFAIRPIALVEYLSILGEE